ncbi:MAG: [FeFe] hydrogenase H-cluster radical SAM maturase HydG [Candidatus Kapaibacterium sp.]
MNREIINEESIGSLLDQRADSGRVNEIIAKAKELKGIGLEEAAVLLNTENPDDINKIFEAANFIKNEIYGKRLVLFAPLYISNYCSNNCLYCGFRAANKQIQRHTLTFDEIEEETLMILRQGHKRVLMLMGEHHKNCTLDYFIDTIKKVYSVKDEKGSSIRRINVEIAPLTDEEFQKFREIPIGTYTVFQETYNRETYKAMHPTGKKADYDWRIETMDRALDNGMHDVGIGALFGLYDYRFETLALLTHAEHLDKKYNVGPHTISIPRIKPAENAPMTHNIPHRVSDTNFKKLVAVLRLSVPYTGMILSTREPAQLRTELFELGISQISAGSKTKPGGYKQAMLEPAGRGQFDLNDCRSSGEIIQDVLKRGYIPSFCTGCYRLGRVGEDFMDLAKPGLIKLHCLPNGLATLKEYLEDYADEETKQIGYEVIKREIENIPSETRKKKTKDYLTRIEKGERDLYF